MSRKLLFSDAIALQDIQEMEQNV